MPLAKTQTGREALHQRDRTLSPRERQILVIADGTRSQGQLVALLGQAAETPIARLLQMGFLQSLEQPKEMATRDQAAQVRQASPSPEPPTRRSLVATKVYCVGMLQLIREAEAGELVRAIQSCATEPELIDSVLRCLRYVQQNTAPSYAAKVAARLAEIVPQQHLASLAECQMECAPAHP